MKTLLKGGKVINVFTDTIEDANVLIEDDIVLGVGDYTDDDADIVNDVTGKIICPGFIDAHIHIESTMLTPAELAKVALPHGTTSIFADPHEIANVCGTEGIEYMLEMSEGIPLHVYIMLPSCVPATPFDESGAVLNADDLRPLYDKKRVTGLAEMMNYPGLIAGVPFVVQKTKECKDSNRVIDGHAPMLTGHGLDRYVSYGVSSDHECTSEIEAKERISKGQYIFIREGTAAKNLRALKPLFDEPWNHRCALCSDDRHPADLLHKGHIDNIIRKAVRNGKDPIIAIRMATIQAAMQHEQRYVGAVAPGYRADILVLNDLNTVDIKDVYSAGVKVVSDKKVKDFVKPTPGATLNNKVRTSFNLEELKPDDLKIDETGKKKCRVIDVVPREILTKELITDIDFDNGNNGIDLEQDILKLAVIERHHNTGHKGVGYIRGIGLKAGAIASSISHDSHNLIVIGTNDADMIAVANHIREIEGGCAIVVNGEVVAEERLPIAGLMTDGTAEEIARDNQALRDKVREIGVNPEIEPFMNMAFVSLPVIPSLKMSTLGLIDVDKFEPVSLVVK